MIKFPNAQVYLDICLTGLEGHFDSMVSVLDIPFGYNNYDTSQLEMLNIVIAANLWAYHWKDKKFRYM